MSGGLVYALEAGRLPDAIGRKAAGLVRLHQLHVRLPKTWVVPYDGYRRYLADDASVSTQLAQELAAILDPEQCYAVRSSASLEDDVSRTFAGQFKTVLDCAGTEAVIQAIWSVWATARSDGVVEYLERMKHPTKDLEMAVLVQEMVQPELAGVAFNRNPVTGRDEVVIEAVRGKGTALVQDGVTPLHWVNRYGRWAETPEAADLASVDGATEVVTAVAEQARRIANKVGYDVDLEWAWDGRELTWLQLRRVTSTHETRVYSNAISKEMLPGMIKPLVWSVNVPQTNGVWVDLITEVIGKNDIDPTSLAKQFHYHTYFDTSTFGQVFESLGMPPDALDHMAGIKSGDGENPGFMPGPRALRHLPRMLRLGVKLWTLHGRARRLLVASEAALDAIPVDPKGLDEAQLLRRLEDLFEIHRPVITHNVVVPFLLRFYEAMLRKGLARAEIDAAALDLVAELPGFDRYDLPTRMARANEAFRQLDPSMQQQIRGVTSEGFRQLTGIADFQSHIDALVRQFGHLSDSVTDFSNVTWREQPDLVLQMVADHPAPTSRAPSRVGYDELPLTALQRWRLRLWYRRARQFRYLREAFSAVYTQGLGLIRATFLGLGDSFASRGILNERDDIFYLYEGEIRRCVAGDLTGDAFPALVARRKAEMALSRNAELPAVIYGDEPPPLLPRARQTLRGTATSPGYYTGTVRVVRGLSEFRKLTVGDVLVVPYSDVAWTPLFARAGAVVAESGGMLSHSSIIAREYGIPAVVSVAGALSLPELATVTVDGYTGEIVVHEEADPCES